MPKLNGVPVSEHLGHPLGNLRGGEADIYHGVCAHCLRLGNHAICGLVTGFLKHFGIARDFSSHDCFEPGHDVASDVFGANGTAADDTKMRGDQMASDIFGSCGYHITCKVTEE